MAFPLYSPKFHPVLTPPPTLSSFSFLSLHSQSQTTIPPFSSFRPCFSPYTTHAYTQSKQPQLVKVDVEVQTKKRKPKPSFYEQVRLKWSQKSLSQTNKFPWQKHQEEEEEEPCSELAAPPLEMVGDPVSSSIESPRVYGNMVDRKQNEEPLVNFERIHDKKLDDSVGSNFKSSGLYGCLVDSTRIEEPQFDVERKFDEILDDPVSSEFVNSWVSTSFAEKNKDTYTHLDYEIKNDQNCDGSDPNGLGFHGNSANDSALEKFNVVEEVESSGTVDVVQAEKVTGFTRKYVRHGGATLNVKLDNVDTMSNKAGFEGSVQEKVADRLPWMPENDLNDEREESGNKSKAQMAEKTIPEHELKRLRNVALRMKERIKVGAAGVTHSLVDTIHEKWKIDEVVKLKFEGPPSLNMKRVHDVLENRTGGLVIWRSGSSVVLYRGLNYKLGCVQTYVREKGVNLDNLGEKQNSVPDSMRLPKDLSEEELLEINELNKMLDDLGPRYVDWSGRPPPPIDADLLPGVVPGYKTPFRVLPHGVRHGLRDEETTKLRRLARTMAPHFALGRNRELQGLAAAMVKLWQKSAVAKIAIKRGVLNTNNERMAEQLKKLTGGTLLSRNKEYIVFYRGNDFLTPSVTEALKDRENLTMLQYQEEEARRYASALINSHPKSHKTPMVAGTLAETLAATSRWGKQPSSEEVEKMLKESAISRHATLVKHLEKKLAWAKGKLKKAEKALEKVQESLKPQGLPTDQETITDEERLVFRKMGLSMKPYLPLGRREVFDGTIENIHQHWKFRELVKLIVKEKKFAQVKHIAISLEAESGGVLVSIDKTTKGYAIILYRGKNYQRPLQLRPRNLLTRRQALARSIELQRREGVKHHISSLQEQIELLKSGLEDMKGGKEIDDKSFYEKLGDSSIPSDDDIDEDEGVEAYLQTYDSGDESVKF